MVAARFIENACVCGCMCLWEGVGFGWETTYNVKLFTHGAIVAFVLFL